MELWRHFILIDVWNSFKFSVLLLWLPIFVIGALSVNWPPALIYGWLTLLPVFWVVGLVIRGIWFFKFYRTSASFEEDYLMFAKRK